MRLVPVGPKHTCRMVATELFLELLLVQVEEEEASVCAPDPQILTA